MTDFIIIWIEVLLLFFEKKKKKKLLLIYNKNDVGSTFSEGDICINHNLLPQ